MIPADLLAALRDALGIAAGDTSKDATIERTASAALARMRRVTGRVLYPLHDLEESFSPPPVSFQPITLRELPVASLTSIEEAGIAGDVAAFRVNANGLLERVAGGAVTAGWARVVVRYVAGYPTLPEDLFNVLASLCAKAVAAGTSTSTGTVRKVSIVDVGAIEYADEGGAGADPILGDFVTVVADYASPAAQMGGHPQSAATVLGVHEDAPA